jgi:hypothetical protein
MKFALALLTLASLPAFAAPPATLKDLAFITGHWRAEMGPAVIEEIWLAPEGDSMYSLFRMVQKGQTRFTEFQAFEQRGESPVLLLRHFGPGLIAREEKDAPLVWDIEEIAANRVLFRQRGADTRLEYLRDGSTLNVTLIKEGDGKPVRTPFRFSLVTGR